MDWNGFASSESSWEAEGGRWQSGQPGNRHLVPAEDWYLLSPFSPPATCLSATQGCSSTSSVILSYIQWKRLLCLLLPFIFWLLSRRLVISVYNTIASVISCVACDLEQSKWKKFGTQSAKAQISSQKGTLQSRNTAQCPRGSSDITC